MLKNYTPCDDYPFICPYGANSWNHCEWFCGEQDDDDYTDYRDYDDSDDD